MCNWTYNRNGTRTLRKSAQTEYKIPISTVISGSYASKEDKAIKSQAIKKFMNEAKEGNIYEVGGSSGTSRFEVVSKRKSPTGLGLKWLNSNMQSVNLTAANAAKFINTGAKLVDKRKKFKQLSLFD